MAKIVLGIGTSHGPMLTTQPDDWKLRLPDDYRATHYYHGRGWTYDELVREREPENIAAQLEPEVMAARKKACDAAIAELSRVYFEAAPDIAVIVGNDQMEIFKKDFVPAMSLMVGPTIVNSPYSDEKLSRLPPGIAVSVPGHIPPGGASYPAHPELAGHIMTALMDSGFDMTALQALPGDETPHAFGFVYRQIMKDLPCPSVPVLINTFYPPNQPRVARCIALGRALVDAIESWDSDLRVALICSGGLTHFVIDEEVDGAFLDGIRAGEPVRIEVYGEQIFQAGTSEPKNWIPVAVGLAARGFKPTVVDYVPEYRSPAGTGNGQGFVYWLPEGGGRA